MAIDQITAGIVALDRRSGQTTRQMLTAPDGAVFVWCNDIVGYARSLARDIGRHDLKIEPSGALLNGAPRLRGLRPRMIVIDHALRATPANIDGLRMVDMSNARQ